MFAVLFLQLLTSSALHINLHTISTLRFQLYTYPGRTLDLSEYCPAEDAEVFTVQF